MFFLQAYFFLLQCSGLSIGFETSEYTVSENGGSVQLCLMFRGPLKNDSFVELQISLFPYTAGGRSDKKWPFIFSIAQSWMLLEYLSFWETKFYQLEKNTYLQPFRKRNINSV